MQPSWPSSMLMTMAGILQELTSTIYEVALKCLWAQKPDSDIAMEELKLRANAQKATGTHSNVAN